MRVVVDTGILVSGLIRPQGTSGEVLRALRGGRFIPVYSTPTIVEIIDVLGRPFFREKYRIYPGDATTLVNLLRLRGELVIPQAAINACRDPKNNKFLEAAIAGNADVIASGDKDLLVLNPFEEIAILNPAEFLTKL